MTFDRLRLALVTTLVLLAPAAFAGTAWVTAAPMNAARLGHTLTLLDSGKVLVAGGSRDGVAVLSATEIYDPAANTWMPAAPMTRVRQNHEAVALANGKVLVVGGNMTNNGAPLAAAESYNPSTNAWSPAGRMLTGRYFFTATRLSSGKVLVVGGCNQASCWTVTPTAEIYDPATNTWARTGSLRLARDYHTATLLADGRVLVTGGYTVYGTAAKAEIWDPATGTWSPGGTMNAARSGHAAALLGTAQVLVAGGGITAELYTPSVGNWTLTGSMSKSRSNPTLTLLGDGRAIVVGGTTYQRPYYLKLATTEYYDVLTGSFTPGPTMAVGRTEHAAVLLKDGRLMVAGGIGASGYLASVEIL